MRRKKSAVSDEKKNKLGRKIFLFVLIVEILFLSSWTVRILRQAESSRQEVREAQAQLRSVKEKNAEIKETEKKLTQKFYREKLAREKLSLAGEGEIIYKILPSSSEKKSYLSSP